MTAFSNEMKMRLANLGPELYRRAGSPPMQFSDGSPNPGDGAVDSRGNTAGVTYVGDCLVPELRDIRIHKKLCGE